MGGKPSAAVVLRADRVKRRALLGYALSAGGGLVLPACAHRVAPDFPRQMRRPSERGERDVTFLVAADTHFGADGLLALNRQQIAAMHGLVGMHWPARSDGSVAEPRGVIVAGDLTESGSAAEWQQFVDHYGASASEGMLRYPAYAGTGNHDRSLWRGHRVLDEVRQRHGALLYGWAWDGLCVLCLDLAPTGLTLRWLRRQLELLGPRVPVVLFFHYPLRGLLAHGWRPEQKEQFALAIAGANVVGIFHGHYHATSHYRWQGHDVYNVGSPKHRWHSFAAVRITEDRMWVASWEWDHQRWGWFHRKRLG